MIKILDENLRIIDILRKYTFVQHEECFREIGNFKINAQITDSNLYLLEKNKYYVLFDDDIFGEIKKVNKDSDGEFERTIVVEGKMSLNLLKDRVVNRTIKFDGKTYKLVYELIKQNIISNEVELRNINIDLQYHDEQYLESICSDINKQITGGYVWDNVQELLEQDKMGIIFNPIVEPVKTINEIETNIYSWEMKISAGIDRRKGNVYGNEAIVFSQSLSNIQRTSYNYETEGYKNVAYIAGEGEGTNRRWYEVYVDEKSKEKKGWNRKELWIDARDIQSEQDERKITDEEYEKLIIQRANEKFSENSEIESYTATIAESNKQYVYGKDYFLGDLVTIIDNELGIEIDAQVTKVTISEQGNRKITDTEFTYGKIKRDPVEEIKKINKNIERQSNDIKYLENSLEYISPIIKKMYLMFHPIGDIVMNTSGVNPGTIFGGVWESWGTGRVPIGVNTSDGNFNTVEKTGGSKTVNSSHTHSLSNARAGVGRSSDALGSLSYVNGGNPHNVTFDREFAYAGGILGVSKTASDTARIYGNTDSGGSTTLSILPPYITCYMWKRVE